MINDREQFKRYVLTALGSPVIKVNVTDEQLEDRVDEAVDMWHQYHNEGSMRMFLKQIITPSVLKVKQGEIPTLLHGSEIIGLTSHARAKVVGKFGKMVSGNGQILCYDCTDSFMTNERIAVRHNGKDLIYTLVDTPDFFIKGIYDEKKFKVPSYVLGITKILPANTATSSQDLFDVQYQLRLSDIYDLTSTSLIYYEQAMQHLDLLSFELNANPYFEFNRHEGYVYPICKWGVDFHVGDNMILEAYRALDPRTASMMWNDNWLKKYTIALVKRQWATNLKKYSGIQLAGGVTLNGAELYQEAITEIQALETELMSLLPPSAFFIG